MKRKVVALLLVLILVLNVFACKKSEDKEKNSIQEGNTRADFVFADDCNRDVAVPGNVSKIIASGPLSQIVIFAIAPEMMVGLASEWDDCAKGIIADKYFKLPYIGQIYSSADLNVEELAMTGAELVIDVGEGKKSIVEDMDAIEAQTGIPAVHIEADLETMPEAFRKLGKLLNREEKGEELAQFCEEVYGRTTSVMDKVGENKIEALYITGEEGLNVLAKGSYHAEILDMLVDNIAVVDNPSSKGLGNSVNIEQIASWNPEFIIFTPGSIYSTVDDMSIWKDLRAIIDSNYIEVPQGPHSWMGMPPSVQRYLGMIWLTAELYPEYCDYSIKEEVKEYYKLFYHCELTDEQYNGLTINAFRKK